MRSYRSSLLRRRPFHAPVLLLLAACAEDTPTSLPVDGDGIVADLAFVVPTGIRDRLVRRTLHVDAPPTGPARSEHLGYGSYPGYDPEPITEAAGIWDAKTQAWFLTDKLSVVGSHEYIANKSSVDTRATLALGGTVLGTDGSYRENAHPFLLPPLWGADIWTEARIFTDRTCGLSGWGDSSHRAWWEGVIGGPVSNFSVVAQTSKSDRATQPPCPTTPPPSTGFTSTSGGGGEAICYLWITYDLYTGQIYDQQLLFCTDGG